MNFNLFREIHLKLLTSQSRILPTKFNIMMKTNQYIVQLQLITDFLMKLMMIQRLPNSGQKVSMSMNMPLYLIQAMIMEYPKTIHSFMRKITSKFHKEQVAPKMMNFSKKILTKNVLGSKKIMKLRFLH